MADDKKAGTAADDKKAGTADDDQAGTADDKKAGTADDYAELKAAIAKEREARRKAEADAKAGAKAVERLKELEDADKTEIERVNERIATAERKAAEAEARALRAEVAAEKGLTAALAKRLVGVSREDLETDADELLEAFGSKKADEGGDKGSGDTSDQRSRPKEKLRSGSVPEAEPEENDPTKLAALIPRG